MSAKDYNLCLNIIDATTGDVLETVLLRNHPYSTLETIFNDFFFEDYDTNKHGILLKYGIKQ